MSLYLTAVLAASILKAFGQITVTATAFPVAGDTVRFSIDTFSNVAPGLPGGNQVWDYASLGSVNDGQTVYRPASEGQNSAGFPGAELVSIGQAGNETYYNTKPTRFEVIGYTGGGPAGLPLNLLFSPPVAQRRAPMTFGGFPNQEKTDLAVTFPLTALPDSLTMGLGSLFDSVRIGVHFERLDFVDAWGSIKLPAFTHAVLREKRFEQTNTKFDLHLKFPPSWIPSPFPLPGAGLDTTITYNYFSENDKEAVAVVTMNNDETKATSVRYKRGATTASTEPTSTTLARPTVQAYPNPAVEYTIFHCSNVPDGKYTLKLYNILGDVVWRQDHQIAGGNKKIRLELVDFKKGTYLYSLTDAKGNIIGTKRLMVVKP